MQRARTRFTKQLEQLVRDVLPHSPNLARSDCRLSRSLRNYLNDTNSSSSGDCKDDWKVSSCRKTKSVPGRKKISITTTDVSRFALSINFDNIGSTMRIDPRLSRDIDDVY